MRTATASDPLALAEAPAEVRSLIEACLEDARHEFGDELSVEGEVPAAVHVLVSGRARTTMRNDDGTERTVGTLGPGGLIGAESVIGAPSPITVRASGPARTLRLHPSVARALAGRWAASAAALEAALVRPPSIDRPLRSRPDPAPTGAASTVPLPRPAPESVSATDWSRFARTGRLPRVPTVFGVDEMDCGAAALTAVCRAFGHPVSFAAVRDAVSTAADGTSLLGLHRGAEALGLDATMTSVSASRLDDLPLPALVHVDGNHWVVLDRVGRRDVRVMDPIGTSGRVDRASFLDRFTGFALLLSPTERLANAPVARPGRGLLGPFIAREWKAITVATVCSAGIAAAQLAVPLSSGRVIDRVITPRDTGGLLPVILVVFGVLALASLLTLLQRYTITRAALRIDRGSLDNVAHTLLALPASFFGTRRTGDIERRLNGLREVRSFFLTRGVAAMVALFEVLGALVVMAHWDLRLTAIYFTVAPLYALLMVTASRRLRPAFFSLEESWGRYKSRQIDAIRGIETVKAAGAEPNTRRALAAQFDDLSGRLFRADFTIMLYEGALAIVSLVPLILFLWLGSISVVHGRISLSIFVSFVAMVIVVTSPMTQLFAMWDVAQQARVLLERLGEFVDHEPEQVDGPGRHPGRVVGDIRLDRVRFRYPGTSDRPVLDDISVRARPGQTIAIVGRSGAGKSTLLNLVLALERPTAGTVSCDGIDLADIDLGAYRSQLGVVLQESHLFDATIAENISFGDEEVDGARMIAAARAALADEFILALPLGYGTRVGERGIRLSGGERQRLCLARALYRDPAVLLLDEATSALDAESEKALQVSLRAASAGRTVLVVAHRLSTVRDADEILVLDAGRIIERGTHSELLDRRGIYFELAANQLG